MSLSFKRPWHGPVLSGDEGVRQGQAVKSALATLGSNEGRAFLNRHHAGLRGRPLDLAVASEAGLKAVQTALCVEARRPAATD